jgi:hypothetical protein
VCLRTRASFIFVFVLLLPPSLLLIGVLLVLVTVLL